MKLQSHGNTIYVILSHNRHRPMGQSMLVETHASVLISFYSLSLLPCLPTINLSPVSPIVFPSVLICFIYRKASLSVTLLSSSCTLPSHNNTFPKCSLCFQPYLNYFWKIIITVFYYYIKNKLYIFLLERLLIFPLVLSKITSSFIYFLDIFN